MQEDVGGGEGEVRDDADRLTLPVHRFGRRPEQGVDRVLAERGEEAVADLGRNQVGVVVTQRKIEAVFGQILRGNYVCSNPLFKHFT